MKALILASGTGSRLKPLTDDIPKCLVKVNEKTILERQLDRFLEAGIKDVIITTGPFEEKISEAIRPYKKSLNIKLVKNEVYDKTNYIFSIYRAKEELNDDILLAHGDLVFDKEVVDKLIKSDHKNTAIVKKDFRPPKDFKAQIKNGRILNISVNLEGEDTHFLAPLYKFSKNDFQQWLNKIEEYVAKEQVHCYAENALNELLPKQLELNPFYLTGETCMEIDELEDLKLAQSLFP